MRRKSGRYHLVGLTSYGKDADCSDAAVVFMAVNAALGKWIQDNVGQVCYRD